MGDFDSASFWSFGATVDEDEVGDGADNDSPENENKMGGREALIFMIDASSEMFKKNEKDEVFFEVGIQAAKQTLIDKIVANTTDLVGVCFFNTKEMNNSRNFKNISILLDLDMVDAPSIAKVANLCGSEGKKQFDKDFGQATSSADMEEILWVAQEMFSSNNHKVSSKRVFIITNEDNPCQGDNTKRKKAIQRARDCSDLDIGLELFFLTKQGPAFNANHFYKFVLNIDEDEENGYMPDACFDKDSLISRVKKRAFKKRSLGKFPFWIGDMEIGMASYVCITKALKSSYVWCESEGNQPIKIQSQYYCPSSGMPVLPNDQAVVYKFQDQKLIFSRDEIAEIKTFGSPGLTLMGFKPVSELKIYYNVKHSTFVYPDEMSVSGSTVAMIALHKKMLELDKMAICRLIFREGFSPRFVAMVAQKERYHLGDQYLQPGFVLIPLPYADDLRDVPGSNDTVENPASDEVNASAYNLIENLTILPEFDSRNYENPALSKHFKSLHKMGLDMEMDELDDWQDRLLPDVEGAKKAEPFILDFKSKALGDDYVGAAATPVKKAAPKRARAEPSGGDVDMVDLDTLIATNSLKKLKVGELKDLLSAHGQPVSGKKDELVSRLEDFHAKKAKKPKK